MITIGVAGHIDHGKSSLVKALTSIDPDRLPEEKLRGMTLDLGFAWLALDSGEKVGIVDVPGHEHFVRNVIPGMSGIDGAVLVVAADDGWMPQTEEHMQIINILGIRHCIIALNKIDMVEDADWLEMVEDDIKSHIQDTVLQDSPVVRVSAREGYGVADLKAAIAVLVEKVSTSRDIGRPRLPVDRVFTIKGSGVVVTGTLNMGSFASGDDVLILPDKKSAHIRSIECYKDNLSKVMPGCRVALNLAGVKKEELERGHVIVPAKSVYCLSKVLNVEIRLLNNPLFRIRTGEEVLVYIETGEYLARVVVLEGKEIKAGQTGLAQLLLPGEISSYFGQHLIIRRQSPADTIGGGVVLDPFARRLKAKNIPDELAWLNRKRTLELDSLVLSELERHRFIAQKDFLACSQYEDSAIANVLERFLDGGSIKAFSGYIFMAREWQTARERVIELLQQEHRQNPLKKGVSQSILQTWLDLPREVFNALSAEMIETGQIVRGEDWLALAGHKPQASLDQQKLIEEIMNLFKANPVNPPTFKELTGRYPGCEEIVYYLLDEGLLLQLPEGVLMERGEYGSIKTRVIAFFNSSSKLTIQDINRLFGFSRKYSLPVLLQLDKDKVTRREGDYRVLYQGNPG